MKRSFLLLSILVCIIYSCKKEDGMKAQYAKLIVGSWKSTGQNTKVYDLSSNELLKDSTIDFFGKNANLAWVEIYDTGGSGFVTTIPTKKQNALMADTTSYLTYNILGSNLVLKQSIGGSTTKPILGLDNSNMDLQSTATGALSIGWGLDVNGSYKIIQSTHYTKQ